MSTVNFAGVPSDLVLMSLASLAITEKSTSQLKSMLLGIIKIMGVYLPLQAAPKFVPCLGACVL